MNSIERRVGWTNGTCLAIDNPGLAPASAVTVLSVDDAGAVAFATIAGRTDSPDVCPALLPDRRSGNAKWSFYQLNFAANAPDAGVGVTSGAVRVGGGVDITGDGSAETAAQCSTVEGLTFSLWSGQAYRGKALWTGYYYLAYDTEPSCPAGGS